MSEVGSGGMRARVLKELRSLHAKAVENSVEKGFPDVHCTLGVIELKTLDGFKRNCDYSPVLVSHFTLEQRRYLQKHWESGGFSYLLLRVGRAWLLYSGAVAAQHVGRATRPELLAYAEAHWPNGFARGDLKKCLMQLWRQRISSILSATESDFSFTDED